MLHAIYCRVALFQCSLRLNHARKKYAALLRELEVVSVVYSWCIVYVMLLFSCRNVKT